MKVYLGADHGGFRLKERLKNTVSGLGFEAKDLGASSEESVDYPDFAEKVAKEVAKAKGNAFGILVCGTGIGMAIAANKVRGIRAAVCWDANTAKLAREHNNANVLCMGERVLAPGTAEETAKVFLTTPFSNEERHVRRIKKISALEK